MKILSWATDQQKSGIFQKIPVFDEKNVRNFFLKLLIKNGDIRW